MKKIGVIISSVLLLLPAVSSAANIATLNGLNTGAQFLATTTDSTTMHMKIVSASDTHTFKWDNTPWTVAQGGTGATSFTNGSILFYTNEFSQDNSNLFWDAIYHVLGIGTNSTSTLSKLTIKGSTGQSLLNLVSTLGVSQLFVAENGNVGLSTTNPQHKLDVVGAIYSELVNASGSTIDWNAGNVQSLTLTGSPTLSFSNGQAGGEYKLILRQDGTGGRTITWPASVKWANGDAPTLTVTASGVDVMDFVYDGSSYLGKSSLSYRTPPSTCASNASTSGSDLESVGTPSLHATAQKFSPSMDCTSDAIGMYVLRDSGRTQDAYLEVYADSSGAPGTLVETGTTLSVGTSFGWATSTFSGTHTLTQGTNYWLVLNTASTDVSNAFRERVNGSQTSGNLLGYDGSTWSTAAIGNPTEKAVYNVAGH